MAIERDLTEEPPFQLTPSEIEDFNKRFAGPHTVETFETELDSVTGIIWPRFKEQMSFDKSNTIKLAPKLREASQIMLERFVEAPEGGDYRHLIMASLWERAANALENDSTKPSTNGKV